MSTGFGTALMCASAIDVVDLKGEVQSRRLLGFWADDPSANLGRALMCASAMVVPDRYEAEGLPPAGPKAPPTAYEASTGFVSAWMCAHAMGDAERYDAIGCCLFGEFPEDVENPVELNRWLMSRMWESRSDGEVERNAAVPPRGETVGAARYGPWLM